MQPAPTPAPPLPTTPPLPIPAHPQRRELTNFFIAVYALCIGQYLRMPRLALPLAEAMSAALVLGALLGLFVFSAVLPEFSCDAVGGDPAPCPGLDAPPSSRGRLA